MPLVQPRHLALGATDLHTFQLGELDHGLGEIQGIPTSVHEGIESNKQGVVLHLPTWDGNVALDRCIKLMDHTGSVFNLPFDLCAVSQPIWALKQVGG